MTDDPGRREPARWSIDDFLVEPTRDLEAWRWLWRQDVAFPIHSHRGFLGRLVVAFKKLLRPLVRTPQNDLWERQRVFNLLLLERFQSLAEQRHEDRLSHLEGFLARGVEELMHHTDALFARVDQQVDRQGRQVQDLHGSLGAALALVESSTRQADAAASNDQVAEDPAAVLSRARDEQAYLELERRYRGTAEEITARLQGYLPYFDRLRQHRGSVPEILDLGCGRGEGLALLAGEGLPVHGIDASRRMVDLCREQGLPAEQGDVFAVLAQAPPESLGGVVSFHVIEHLPAAQLDRLVRLAWRALVPGGVLILETPNPLSLVAGARNFWLDPTHRRPVHPESLRLLYELAGFEQIELLELRPFPEEQRLPEVDLGEVPEELRSLADQVNRLRDHLDELLYGAQDFAVVGVR